MSEKKQRADQRAFHFVYKTTCSVTGNYYIGMHSTDRIEDGYIGSGQRLWKSIAKHGKENHKREIIGFAKSRKELSSLEESLVTKEVAKLECMNLRVGGEGNFPAFDVQPTTKEKLSTAGTSRWVRDRAKLKQTIEEQLANSSMTRKEILKVLVTPEGHLNKNATRCLLREDEPALGDDRLGKREVLRRMKWRFILDAIQNPIFGDNLVELINAYVFQLSVLPTCKRCEKSVSFFRFGQPYATFCSPRCAMTGNSNAKRAINTARFLGE